MVLKLIVGSTLREIGLWPRGLGHGARDVGPTGVGRCLALLWVSVSLRTVSTHWNVPGKYGPHGQLFFFLVKKEPMVLGELIEFGP